MWRSYLVRVIVGEVFLFRANDLGLVVIVIHLVLHFVFILIVVFILRNEFGKGLPVHFECLGLCLLFSNDECPFFLTFV